MPNTTGAVTAAVLRARERVDETHRREQEPRSTEVPATLVLKLAAKVAQSVDRRTSYLKLGAFLLFSVLYITVLLLQRRTEASFLVEDAVRGSLFTLNTNTLDYDSGDISRSIPDVNSFYTWFDTNIVNTVFVDPVCGDGLCSAPLEFPAFGRFGCVEDCGAAVNLTTVTVTFTLELAYDDIAVLEGITYNLCSRTFGVCLNHDNDRIPLDVPANQIRDDYGVYTNTSASYNLPDGEWELEVDLDLLPGPSSGVGVALAVTNSTNQLEQVLDIAACEPEGTALNAGAPGRRLQLPPEGGGPGDDDMGPGGGGEEEFLPGCDCPVSRLGDEFCEPQCYTEACEWDGGDCCPNSLTPREVHPFSIWNYNTEGSRPQEVFPAQDEPSKRLVGLSNVLIAGVLVTQRRVQQAPCRRVGRFEDVVDTCFSSSISTEPYGVDPTFLSTSSAYNSRLDATNYYSDSEFKGSVPYGFFFTETAEPEDSGFQVFLDVNMDNNRANQTLQYMKDGLFIDQQTRLVIVQLLTFNGDNGLLTRTNIEFDFSTSGTLFLRHHVQALEVEVYGSYSDTEVPDDTEDVGPAQDHTDLRTLRAVLELFVLAGIVAQLLSFLYRVVATVIKRQSLLKFLFGFWHLVELTHIGLLLVSVALWLSFWDNHARNFRPSIRYEVLNSRVWSNNPAAPARLLQVNGDAFQEVLGVFSDAREMSDVRATYFRVAGICVLFLLLRLLSVLDFQPRVGLVTRTLGRASADLSHFMGLFAMFLLGYAVVGHLSFGSALLEFSTVLRSVVTCMEILLGQIDVNEDLMKLPKSHIPSVLIFFWSFIVICFFILINVLLAILVDAYIEVKKHASEQMTMPQELAAVGRAAASQVRKQPVAYYRTDGRVCVKYHSPYLPDLEVMQGFIKWSTDKRQLEQALQLLGLPLSPGSKRIRPMLRESKYTAPNATAAARMAAEGAPQPGSGSRDLLHVLAVATGEQLSGEPPVLSQSPTAALPPLEGWEETEYQLYANYVHRFAVTPQFHEFVQAQADGTASVHPMPMAAEHPVPQP